MVSVSVVAATLLASGAILELGGIVLVGSPDLFPYGRRLSAWLRRRFGWIVNRVRRLIGRPRVHTTGLGRPVLISRASSVSAVRSIREGAPLEDQVAFLLRRDQEAQRRENELSGRLTTLDEETGKRLEALRESMEQHVADSLTAAHEEYLPLRVLGVLLLVAGVGCLTAAAFVQGSAS